MEEAVADHVEPFDSIVERYFREREVDIDTDMLTKSVDATSSPVWRNSALTEEFRAFHGTLPPRLVQARENLSEIKSAANARRAQDKAAELCTFRSLQQFVDSAPVARRP